MAFADCRLHLDLNSAQFSLNSAHLSLLWLTLDNGKGDMIFCSLRSAVCCLQMSLNGSWIICGNGSVIITKTDICMVINQSKVGCRIATVWVEWFFDRSYLINSAYFMARWVSRKNVPNFVLLLVTWVSKMPAHDYPLFPARKYIRFILKTPMKYQVSSCVKTWYLLFSHCYVNITNHTFRSKS